MVPASVELKLYSGVVSLVGVDTAVTRLSIGAVVSMVKGLTCKLLLVLPLLVTLRVQLL